LLRINTFVVSFDIGTDACQGVSPPALREQALKRVLKYVMNISVTSAFKIHSPVPFCTFSCSNVRIPYLKIILSKTCYKNICYALIIKSFCEIGLYSTTIISATATETCCNVFTRTF